MQTNKQTDKGLKCILPLLMVSRVKSSAVMCLNQNTCSTIMLHSQNQCCLGTFYKTRMSLCICLQNVPELVDAFWLQTIVALNYGTTYFSNLTTTHQMPQTSVLSITFSFRFLLELATC